MERTVLTAADTVELRDGATAALPPGPRLPMAVQTALWVLAPVRFIDWCRDHYGEIFTVNLPFNGHVVQLCDPDAIRSVFTAPPADAHAGEVNAVLQPLVGRNSVLLLDGPDHLRQRRLMLPAFHGERMQRYAEMIAEVTEREVRTWPVGQAFALRPSMQRITLEVILRAVFGADDGDQLSGLRRLISELVDLRHSQIAFLPGFRRDLGPRSPWGRFLRNRERADSAIYSLIAARRADADAGVERDDILSMLLQARDENGESMTDAELRDELMTLLLAGHETTATTLAWFFDLMLHHGEILDRLETELASGSTAYLDAAVRETMRMRPVVPVIGRRLRAPLQVGPWRLPAGVAVSPNIVGTHRNPRVYPEPERFAPERFLDQRTDAFSWLPFGGGIRRCLGATFATFEMRIVVPAVLRHARLRPVAQECEPMVRRAVTLVPRHGVRVVATSVR